MKDTEKSIYDKESRKSLKRNDIGMVKYGVPDDVLDPKKTKKAKDVVTRKHSKTKPKR